MAAKNPEKAKNGMEEEGNCTFHFSFFTPSSPSRSWAHGKLLLLSLLSLSLSLSLGGKERRREAIRKEKRKLVERSVETDMEERRECKDLIHFHVFFPEIKRNKKRTELVK